MRMSQFFGRTLRQAPSDVDPATALALRTALIRVVSDEVVFLPLGERAVGNILKSLFRYVDVNQPVLLPPGSRTSTWCELIAGEIQSYRQLPAGLYSHRMILHSEEPRGLSRPEWVTGLQWLWLAEELDGTQQSRSDWSDQIERWFEDIGWAPEPVEWHKSAFGWAVPSDDAPEALLACTSCGYLAVDAWARFKCTEGPTEPVGALGPVPTPDTDTIDGLAAFLDIPVSRTLKAVFFRSDRGNLVFAVLRGDLEISIPKLIAAVGCRSLTPASDEQIRSIGAEPGYASPVGLQVPEKADNADFVVVADVSIENGTNFVAGANKPGFHLTGVNYPRDFQVTILADIAKAVEGEKCPQCDGSLSRRKGYVLGGWQDDACTFKYTNEQGKEKKGFASQGILFLEPIFTALLHKHHDVIGILWPYWLAPFNVHLIELRAPEPAFEAVEILTAQGLTVLHDDRDVSAGVKFADADLIGLPLRITVSKRSLEQGGIEVALRRGENGSIVPIEDLGKALQALINSIM